MATVVADEDVLADLASLPGNLILFGGPQTNAVARVLASAQPFSEVSLDTVQQGKEPRPERETPLEGKTPRLEGGFAIGDCSFTAEGTGLVSLGPRSLGVHGGGGLVASVAGTTLSGFGKAVELLHSDLFRTNSWQHRLPDYMVAGPDFVRSRGGQKPAQHRPSSSLHGVVGAGFWGYSWEYRADSAYLSC